MNESLPLPPMIEALEALVAFDTQNPPGRELEAAQWLKARMAAMGFEASTSEVMPGRCQCCRRLE